MASGRASDHSDHSRSGFRVHGRVQGVGFRWWTRRTAESLRLTGRVRNIPDGTVEVHVAGPAERVAELERRLRTGPRAASVRQVERISATDLPADGFHIDV